nr:PPC domain-containing protein [Kibdelosporangium sp. MJ126-NF4]CEL20525.1 conserved hypothetical protein-putative adhesin [Kibdelosporangium sp. MJ126-NF4]CTQ89436.1 conserved hypothetical protein-putative adhesin [Kibdelosporangium sp. MJ126-NF4]
MRAGLAILGLTVSMVVAVGDAATAQPPDVAAAKARQLAAGVQIVPKGQSAIGADPALAFMPDLSEVDIEGVRRARAARAAEQRAARGITAGKDAKPYTEREPAGVRGRNDTDATAELIAGFGTTYGLNPKVALSGGLVADPETRTVPPFAEDNGSIPLAAAVGAGRRVRTSGVIGDGPHGSAGDGKGDFDFYKVSGLSEVTVDIDTPSSELDSVVSVYGPAGEQIATNDNEGVNSGDSRLTVALPTKGDYYVLVSGFGPDGKTFPQDPKDSASGVGVGSEGSYDLTLSAIPSYDVDVYSFVLRAGDVLGASVTGGAGRLEVHDRTGREVVGSAQDFASIIHPAQSPLPRGGNAAVDFVAPKTGRYTLHVRNGETAYKVALEAYRPGTESLPHGTVQTVFLDFNGADIDPAIFGGPAGARPFTPFAAFIPQWGLSAGDESALVDRIVATVRENVEKDLAATSTNRNFGIRVLNSRDHADPFGQPNVTRLVVGGTRDELGLRTVGIAQSIDPGNFAHEETAVILQDVLSAPAAQSPTSLNNYITPASDKIRFIGTGIGNIAAHELGHLAGSWHQDQFNAVPSLMDQGGNPKQVFGVGPDGIGGTADDADVDFAEDVFNPNENFSGHEDALNRTGWAFIRA